VGAGNAQALRLRKDLGEELNPFEDGDPPLVRGSYFGVVVGDCVGNHQTVDALEVAHVVAHLHLGPQVG
jgi:hypothetical protein